MLRPLVSCLVLVAALWLGERGRAQEPAAPAATPAAWGAGAGPRADGDGWQLLTPGLSGQVNAVAWAQEHHGVHAGWTLRFQLRVPPGGEGGGLAFLDTARFGERGPAPYLEAWEAPSLAGCLAVGIDVRNPQNRDPFGPDGNYRGMPEREVSLHWDGREIVKRCASAEFRGDWVDGEIAVRFVPGGAAVSVQLGPAAVYERYLVPGATPYAARVAAGARSGAAAGAFDLRAVRHVVTDPVSGWPRPHHVPCFTQVLTDAEHTSYRAECELPPAPWTFERVLMTVQIHDAGPDWDEWDRCGHVAWLDPAGVPRILVPFITSYRTECHWVVDVTHFRPWLAGRQTLEIAAGTTFYKNRGYRMSVALDYYPGAPAVVPQRVTTLWHGTAQHGAPENHFQEFFTPQTVPIDADATAARVVVYTTGHSQVGEFTPAARTIRIRAGASDPPGEFRDTLWRDDCYLNPNRPQYGTWKFSRAGWAPGDVVRPWWIDATPHVRPGAPATLEYLPAPYEFPAGREPAPDEVRKAEHRIEAYLVTYRPPTGMVPPPTVQVTRVQDGAGKQAGLDPGDWLETYDGVVVRSLEDLGQAIQAAVAAGKSGVELVSYRGHYRRTGTVAPGRLGISVRTR